MESPMDPRTRSNFSVFAEWSPEWSPLPSAFQERHMAFSIRAASTSSGPAHPREQIHGVASEAKSQSTVWLPDRREARVMCIVRLRKSKLRFGVMPIPPKPVWAVETRLLGGHLEPGTPSSAAHPPLPMLCRGSWTLKLLHVQGPKLSKTLSCEGQSPSYEGPMSPWGGGRIDQLPGHPVWGFHG